MLGGELPAARPAEQASAWREALHPRQPTGSDRGGEFAPKTVGRAVQRTAPGGRKVWVAQLTPEQRAANLAARAAKPTKVEGNTRLYIPGGVTTQSIPNQWLVDNDYAVKAAGGSVSIKRGADQEAILVHYLSGKKPENYPVGTKGFDQFMYGRQLPAGASKEAREAMRKLRGKNKAEREAVVRRITAALVAAGVEEMQAHALVAAAFDESKHPRHAKGSERGGEFAKKLGNPPGGDRYDREVDRLVKRGVISEKDADKKYRVSESRLDAQRRDPDVAEYKPTPQQAEAQVENEVEASAKRIRELMEDYGQHRGKSTPEKFLAEMQRYAYLRWPEAFEG